MSSNCCNSKTESNTCCTSNKVQENKCCSNESKGATTNNECCTNNKESVNSTHDILNNTPDNYSRGRRRSCHLIFKL